MFSVIFANWLVGKDGKQGGLMTIEEVGDALGGTYIPPLLNPEDDGLAYRQLIYMIVPVNVKDRDVFHITIEEYLQSLITVIEELVWPLHSPWAPHYKKQAHLFIYPPANQTNHNNGQHRHG